MKLKLFATLLILTGLVCYQGISYAQQTKTLPSSYLYSAVAKYKNKNYTGCIQDMDQMIEMGRPSDIVYYYKALSYAQLGMNNEAREAYSTALSMTRDNTLKQYAQQAIDCIDDSTVCDSQLGEGDITKFIKSNKFMSDEVKNNFADQAINRVREEINSDAEPSQGNLKYLNNNDMPSDKEIADAVRTFSKLGINPFTSAYPVNNEYAQLSAFLGNNNNNNGTINLLPLISSMQGAQGATMPNKEFIQAYMMNQMLPGFDFGLSDKK